MLNNTESKQDNIKDDFCYAGLETLRQSGLIGCFHLNVLTDNKYSYAVRKCLEAAMLKRDGPQEVVQAPNMQMPPCIGEPQVSLLNVMGAPKPVKYQISFPAEGRMMLAFLIDRAIFEVYSFATAEHKSLRDVVGNVETCENIAVITLMLDVFEYASPGFYVSPLLTSAFAAVVPDWMFKGRERIHSELTNVIIHFCCCLTDALAIGMMVDAKNLTFIRIRTALTYLHYAMGVSPKSNLMLTEVEDLNRVFYMCKQYVDLTVYIKPKAPKAPKVPKVLTTNQVQQAPSVIQQQPQPMMNQQQAWVQQPPQAQGPVSHPAYTPITTPYHNASMTLASATPRMDQ